MSQYSKAQKVKPDWEVEFDNYLKTDDHMVDCTAWSEGQYCCLGKPWIKNFIEKWITDVYIQGARDEHRRLESLYEKPLLGRRRSEEDNKSFPEILKYRRGVLDEPIQQSARGSDGEEVPE